MQLFYTEITIHCWQDCRQKVQYLTVPYSKYLIGRACKVRQDLLHGRFARRVTCPGEPQESRAKSVTLVTLLT